MGEGATCIIARGFGSPKEPVDIEENVILNRKEKCKKTTCA